MAVTIIQDNDGVQTERTNFSKTTHSSDNWQAPEGAVEVVSKDRGRISVSDGSTLGPDDILSVDGVEMTVSQAKQHGVFDSLFSGQQMMSPNQAASQAALEQPTPAKADYGDDGELGDHNDLAEALEANETLTGEERQAYDLVGANLQQAGVQYGEALATYEALQDGSLDTNSVNPQHLEMINAQAARVTEVSTKAAMGELGPDAFNYLQSMSDSNPAVARVVNQYAIDRATAQNGDITWNDLYQHLRDELG